MLYISISLPETYTTLQPIKSPLIREGKKKKMAGKNPNLQVRINQCGVSHVTWEWCKDLPLIYILEWWFPR